MSLLKCLTLLTLVAVLDAARFNCDYKFYKDARGYIKFQEMPLTFDDAKQRCALEGGVLASPINHGIKTAMMSMTNTSKAVFTGISSTSNSYGIFSSVEGVRLSDIPHTWAAGEPDNFKNEERCIAILLDGTMADVKCSEPLPHYCFLQEERAKKFNACGPKNKDYKLDTTTGGCYKFHRTKEIYDDAAKVCETEGGHLLIINEDAEVQVVKTLFSKNPTSEVGKYVLIGFRFNKDLGQWMTLKGETIEEAGYAKWAPGEPSYGHNNQYCGAVYYTGGLDDIYCDKKFPFICEKNPETLLCK